MKFFCLSALTVALLSAPMDTFAEQLPDFDFRHWTTGEELETYRSELFSVHQLCAATASQRHMSGTELELCGAVYLELKLSFLNGVTRERYQSMPAMTRAIAHDKGYAAYRAWLHRRTTSSGSAGILLK